MPTILPVDRKGQDRSGLELRSRGNLDAPKPADELKCLLGDLIRLVDIYFARPQMALFEAGFAHVW